MIRYKLTSMKITNNIDKFGTAGLFLTALFSPCCFPLFAFAASTLGLAGFELFGSWTMWIFQALVLISIFGFYISYRRHRYLYPLMMAILSGFLIFYAYYFNKSDYWTYFLYVGMFGILIATVWNYKRNKATGTCSTCTIYNGQSVETKSTLTCPICRYKKTEFMPTDACVYIYECEKCKALLKPIQGNCCVYCSYGTVKCPSVQLGKNCC